MSQIQELIRRLCPNGVEFKDLGRIVIIKNGKDYKHLVPGNIPVYGSGGIMTYVNKYVYNKPTVLIPRKGSLGNIFYIDTPFWNVDTIFYTEIDTKQIEAKYLYYVLAKQHLENLNKAGGVPSLTQSILNKVKIPVPPLEVQNEIVRILDTFTSHTAELQAELQARKQQYEYYRNKLLSFDKNNVDVRWIKIGEFCKILRGKRLTTKELDTNGKFPVFHGGIKPIGFYPHSNRAANSTMIINVGASAGTVGFCKTAFWSSDGCFCFTHNKIVIQKYLFYVLQSMEISLKSKVRIAGIPTLDNKNIERLVIPVISLSEQQRIISILDKFETLVNDLTEGIPAEIAAVQEQYEYYRNKLLSFPKLEA